MYNYTVYLHKITTHCNGNEKSEEFGIFITFVSQNQHT